ncbi:hypothetical protein FOA52_007240 [Chlamydomonas sp. UWO 241]|nr:hypothetical protein FOA52_007240 [Chlamydomonas sp. UWO 241]
MQASLSTCSFFDVLKLSGCSRDHNRGWRSIYFKPSVPITREEVDSGVPHLLPVFLCELSKVCFREHQHVWVVQPNGSGDIPGVRVEPSYVVGQYSACP